MRLLFLAPSPPAPRAGGGAQRMFQMVRFLGQRFELDLLAPALEGTEEAQSLCKPFCRDMEFVPHASPSILSRLCRLGPYDRNPELLAAVHRRLATQDYGAVQAEKPAMLPYLPRDAQVPVVLDIWAYGLVGPLRAFVHQAGMAARIRNLVQLTRFAFFDGFCWPPTDCILVVSEIDRNRCERAKPDRRVRVVPNGVDCQSIRPVSRFSHDPPIVLFTGDLGFGPNVDAARLLATRIFPDVRSRYPEAELQLVGRNPSPSLQGLSSVGVKVIGEVPDMAPYLTGATVYVAPHFTGAGTRTKLLEAMAAGLPIVTTSVGIEGIEAEHGREVLIADTPRALRETVIRLLGEADQRARLGAAARKLAQERYDWSTCLQPLERFYRDLADGRGGAC